MRSAPTIAVDLRALAAPPTGIGRYTLSLLTALARRGGARFIGMAHREVHGADQLRAAGVELEVEPAPLGVVWQQLALPRRLRRGDVDLLWSPIMTLPLRCPVPAVVTIHDLTPMLLPEAHRLKVRWSVLPFLRPTVDAASRIVVDSEATARDLVTHFPHCQERLRCVYPGVDEVFRPAGAEAIAATRAELGCPDGYLLYAGTLEPRKNVGTLLDAWAALREREPTIPPLVLAGPYGWGGARLMNRVRDLEAAGLRHLGALPRDRLVEVMQAASLFVYPSFYEGFGLPPAEAMACGVPTVVSDRSSLPEVVGEGGVLVDPDDAEALAAAVSSLLADPRGTAALAGRGRERSGRFTWPDAARRLRGIFWEALRLE